MKKLLMLLVISVVAVMWFACAQKTDPEKIKAQAKDLDDRYVAAIQKEDINGIMELHWNSPEVIFYSPITLEEKGYATIQALYENFLAENDVKSLEIKNASYMALGEYGLGWGNFSAVIAGKDGKETKFEGRLTNISGMKDGKWVYIVRHASAPLPPPPTMEEMHKMMQEMSKKK